MNCLVSISILNSSFCNVYAPSSLVLVAMWLQSFCQEPCAKELTIPVYSLKIYLNNCTWLCDNIWGNTSWVHLSVVIYSYDMAHMIWLIWHYRLLFCCKCGRRITFIGKKKIHGKIYQFYYIVFFCLTVTFREYAVSWYSECVLSIFHVLRLTLCDARMYR